VCIPLGARPFPERLAHIPTPPDRLWIRGDAAHLPGFSTPSIAIVGCRTASRDGLENARALADGLARAGVVIVSGLARGVDTLAHTGALIAEGTTVAVLGGGIRQIYPPENAHLVEKILRVQRGAVVSAAHPDAGTTAARLVARNRIIAALCRAVIVVESNDDGGAMHAARRALDLGRQVYTLDLPAGGNRTLIALGARLIDPDRPILA
ncbi:MAG: DNA-protecting protein DprA, partial [Anaerolineae bacterium]|nr:DNA-protecting protein DprA [Anaerolineae bacterium]